MSETEYQRMVKAKYKWLPVRVFWGDHRLQPFDTITKGDLIQNPTLRFVNGREPFSDYTIDSFEIEIICKGETQTMKSYSASLTINMKDRIEKLERGCTILLNHVWSSRRIRNGVHNSGIKGASHIYVKG